ncbi:hypothetical protein B0H14DRAFT_3501585 [Mycena olivaceomarginata]|nr:hypothetical protein B0H14DRAFT_3501585 [Mycena olivaceomarginata]
MGSDHEAEEEVLSSSLNDLDLDPPSPVDILAAVNDLCPVMPLPSSGSVDPPPALPLSSKQRNKLKYHARRARARQQAQQSSSNPKRKTVHTNRLQQGKLSYIEVEYDANGLPHTIPAWIGSRNSQDDDSHFAEPGTSSYPQSGMGGKSYTQEDINRLANTVGFVYICWLGLLTIPILDSRRRIIALLGGTPRDVEGWEKVTQGAASLLQDCLRQAVGRGVSHGGGQMEPGELQQNLTNTRITDDLMAHKFFKRIVGFTNVLFFMWAPSLYALYESTRAAMEEWGPHLRWNFADSVFAACTFNFGPRASIFIPSAIVRHSNVPIQSHETRSSFTQYTAGGLFRWVRNGFMTDEDFELRASEEQKADRNREAETRWEQGMNMFSTIDDLS